MLTCHDLLGVFKSVCDGEFEFSTSTHVFFFISRIAVYVLARDVTTRLRWLAAAYVLARDVTVWLRLLAPGWWSGSTCSNLS